MDEKDKEGDFEIHSDGTVDMKVCMISTGHTPLDDRLYFKETLSLAKRYSPIFLIMHSEENNLEVRKGIELIPLKKRKSLLSRLLMIPRIIATVLKVRPEVCHLHDYELIFILPLLRLLSRSKLIYDAYEVYPEMVLQSENIPRFLRPLFAKAVDINERLLSRFAHHIITADDNIAIRFKAISCKVTTLFNYPRLSIFIPDSNKVDQLRRRYNNRIPIIYHGSMSIQRGLFHMIDAMQILKTEQPKIMLILIGEINERLLKRVEEEIDEKNLHEHIDIIGEVDHREIVNYITVSKIGLIPFLPTEKFKKNIPTKQFEYMACGVPVLGADLPPIASYILTAKCGKVYEPMKVKGLALGVMEMLRNGNEWDRMSEAGRRAVQTLWNWDMMEKKILDVYESLLN
jgi:glycosyltransferase involved in cell wall biosynthesis